jgi:signal transduction histidine kinase/DNA-binding NarL/FixJ family response regulator
VGLIAAGEANRLMRAQETGVTVGDGHGALLAQEPRSLKVLFVEDSADDAELEARELRAAGYEVVCDRVESLDALRRALELDVWEVVISDFNLPGFTGLDALELVRATRPGLPFILVSGTLGEDAAVNAIKAGADEYVLKGNTLRLRAAVPRELRAAEARREMRRAQFAQELLSRSSEQLAESIEYGATLARAARIALTGFADWCALDIVEADGILRRVAFAHVNPAKQKLGELFASEYATDPSAERVVRTGQSLLASEAIASLSEPFDDARRTQLLQELGFESFLVAPLRSRGQTLGAMTFASAHRDRRYSALDLGLGEELARRAAVAIDNANLYEEAQDAIRVRDDFLSIASHELRTPITLLQLLVQDLLFDDAQRPNVARNGISSKAERAKRSIDRLMALVEGLLDVSRISSGPMTLTLEKFDLNQLVLEVADSFRDQADRARCALCVHAARPIVGTWDRVRLEQVLTNLLSNALKYAPGYPVEFGIDARDGKVYIHVSDHGRGIPKTALTRIFGRFERAVPSQHYGGLGLGLYISQRIVEAHGGVIRVASELGAGAVFTVELPCRE